MLTSTERRMLLEFLSKYADGDVLIQAANRVANNINDVDSLRKYIEAYKPTANPNDYLSEKGKETPYDGMKPVEPVAEAEVEDLGPVPKKLGVNGQNILNLMTKEHIPWSVDALAKKLKISASKVKPMLALLLVRGKIARHGSTSYSALL